MRNRLKNGPSVKLCFTKSYLAQAVKLTLMGGWETALTGPWTQAVVFS